MRKIERIFVHCTASSQKWGVKELLAEFKAKGWINPGYHKVITEDGEETADIWFDTECETMNIDNALYMLKELEVYSKQTNNVTHQHKAEVIALISIEEVKAYDIIKDYTKNQL